MFIFDGYYLWVEGIFETADMLGDDSTADLVQGHGPGEGYSLTGAPKL